MPRTPTTDLVTDVAFGVACAVLLLGTIAVGMRACVPASSTASPQALVVYYAPVGCVLDAWDATDLDVVGARVGFTARGTYWVVPLDHALVVHDPSPADRAQVTAGRCAEWAGGAVL